MFCSVWRTVWPSQGYQPNIPPPSYMPQHQPPQLAPLFSLQQHQQPQLQQHPYFGSPYSFNSTAMFSGLNHPIVSQWSPPSTPVIPMPSYQQHSPFGFSPQTVQPPMFSHNPSSLFSPPPQQPQDTAMDEEVDPFKAFKQTYSNEDIVEHYHPPSKTTIEQQNKLALDIHQHIHKSGSQMLSAENPESLPEDLAERLRGVIAEHAPLNLGLNPLGGTWDKSLSGYGGSKTGPQQYAAVRSMEPVRDHIKKVTTKHPEKTGELHHGLKKGSYPIYSVDKRNLFLLTRKHNDTMGQHDMLHHVMASHSGNKWQKSVPGNDVEMSNLLGLGAFTPKSQPSSSGKTYSKLIHKHL